MNEKVISSYYLLKVIINYINLTYLSFLFQNLPKSIQNLPKSTQNLTKQTQNLQESIQNLQELNQNLPKSYPFEI